MRNVLTVSILGYGISIKFFGYDKNKDHDGSLQKFGVEKGGNRWLNPYITFMLWYRWITLLLLLNKN